MEQNIFIQLEELHTKSMDLVHAFAELPARDIKRGHIEAMSSQIAVSLINLKICFKYSEENKKDFLKYFNDDNAQAENFIFNFKQSIVEAILDTALFQTELVLRVLYSALTGVDPSHEGNINKIIATVFDDTQNNWQKEEAKLLVLFWTVRNTIHTGGIYYKKLEGYSLTYKGQEYKFEYKKSIGFFKNGHLLELFSDLLDSLNFLFTSKIITDLGSIEHPSYYALGY